MAVLHHVHDAQRYGCVLKVSLDSFRETFQANDAGDRDVLATLVVLCVADGIEYRPVFAVVKVCGYRDSQHVLYQQHGVLFDEAVLTDERLGLLVIGQQVVQ